MFEIAFRIYDVEGFKVYDEYDIINYAAKKGYMDQLNYLDNSGFKVNINTLREAVISGNLDCVKWVLDKGGLMYVNDPYHKLDIINAAIRSKNMSIIDWAINNKYSTRGVADLAEAYTLGDTKLLDRLYDLFKDDGISIACDIELCMFPDIVLYTTQTQNYEVIDWVMKVREDLKRKKFRGDPNGLSYYYAVSNRDLKLIEYLYKNGIKSNINLSMGYAKAYVKGYEEITKWFDEKNIRIKNEEVLLRYAAFSGDVEIVKWLRKDNTEDVNMMVFNGHNLPVLKFLKESGCPLSENVNGNYQEYDNTEYILWLLENNYKFTQQHINILAGCENLDCLKSLYYACETHKDMGEIHTLIRSVNVMNYFNAMKKNHVETAKWIQKVGCTYNNNTVVRALKSSSFYIAEFIFRNYGVPELDSLENQCTEDYPVPDNRKAILSKKVNYWKSRIIKKE